MSSLVSAEFWGSDLHTSYWLPKGGHRDWDEVGIRRRITVRSGGSSNTRWRMAAGLPGHHLRNTVQRYVEYAEASTSPVGRREIPGPGAILVIELAAPFFAAGAADTGGMRPVTAFICSPGCGPTLTWHPGAQHRIEVVLTLLGVYRLFGAIADLAGHIAPLDNVWPSAALLRERLVAAGDIERRFELLDSVLGRANAAAPEPDPEISHAWMRLRDHGGRVPINRLLVETGWSHRRLTTRFCAQTGLTPKVAATLLRFHRASRRIEQSDDYPLTEIAQACGYYDQAHLNRDFRKFAGCSPTEWRHSRLHDLPGPGLMPDRH